MDKIVPFNTEKNENYNHKQEILNEIKKDIIKNKHKIHNSDISLIVRNVYEASLLYALNMSKEDIVTYTVLKNLIVSFEEDITKVSDNIGFEIEFLNTMMEKYKSTIRDFISQ